MPETVFFILVALPFLAAGLLYLVRSPGARGPLVLATTALVALAALLLPGREPFLFALGPSFDTLVTVADFALLAIILGWGIRLRNAVVIWLTLAQAVGLFWFEFYLLDHDLVVPTFFVDPLARIMVLVVSIVGSLVVVFALGYMRRHEEHLHLAVSRQPRFFFLLTLFLGAMNGLVLSNNLLWLYFFWEITTLCSFLLIRHDDTPIARTNSERQLWMNVISGAAFLAGIILIHKASGTISLVDLFATAPMLAAAGVGLSIPLFFFVLAGMGKAAQPPFQGWLCGAMVAPTPVSALLHSSTMVKAGVYLVIRLAPLFAGTFLGQFVTLFGAFSFTAMAALAVGQSNGKKILAYSTISNLGLIIACAGINTPTALTAAMLLIIFHAVSKGLLFLCVGTIEQQIGSRDIEDMRGLFRIMPHTTVITLIGVTTMMLPPFGMLLAKWMAIESASGQFLVMVLLAVGSGLTVLFWARMAGVLLSAPFSGAKREAMPNVIRLPLMILAGGAVLLSLLSPLLYTGLVEPAVTLFYDEAPYALKFGSFSNEIGVFTVYPLFLLLGAGVFLAVRAARRLPAQAAAPPYMCGEETTTEDGRPAFRGPLGQIVPATSGNVYLASLFGEATLTRWVDVVALVILAVMLGGVL